MGVRLFTNHRISVSNGVSWTHRPSTESNNSMESSNFSKVEKFCAYAVCFHYNLDTVAEKDVKLLIQGFCTQFPDTDKDELQTQITSYRQGRRQALS